MKYALLIFVLCGMTACQKAEPESPIDKLKSRAASGDANAQFELGSAYQSGEGVLKNQNEAIAWCRKAAEQGHVVAQFYLGESYAKGEGLPKDLEAAATWWRKAADQGMVEAQYSLGLFYFTKDKY